MSGRGRFLVASSLAVLGIVVVVLMTVRSPEPSGARRLERLVSQFMKSLPDETTAAEREEIRGIMDRFYAKAVVGELDARGVVGIEADIRGFLGRGGITKDELRGFLSKVGSVTRGTAPAAGAASAPDSGRGVR
jgi:hypothetical protein